MKKLLIILSFFLTLSLSGQIYPGVISSQGVSGGEDIFCENNMISNGEFTDGTGWTANTGWSIGSGVATNDDATMGSKLIQAAGDMVTNVVAGHNYTISFDITISSGNAHFGLISSDDNAAYANPADYANGHHSVDFTAPGWVSAGGLGINVDITETDNSFTIDNICLVEI
jgi:hypothetical protein